MANEKNVKRGPTEFSSYHKSEDKNGFDRSEAMRKAYDSIVKSMSKDTGGSDAGNKNDG